jgi:uncharacterized membrane protein YccC
VARSWLEELRHLVSVNRSGLAFLEAARCTLGLLVPLVVGLATGAVGNGVSAAVGSLVVGFVSFEGRHGRALKATLLTALGVAGSVLVGALVGQHPVLLALALVTWGIGGGVIGSLGPVPSLASLQAIVALVVFSAIPLSPGAALIQAAWVLCGGLLQVVLLRLIHPRSWLYAERLGLADALLQLARYAEQASPGPPPADQLDAATDALSTLDPSVPPADLEELTALLLVAERLRVAMAGALWRNEPETVHAAAWHLADLAARLQRSTSRSPARASDPQHPGQTDAAPPAIPDPVVAELLEEAEQLVARLEHHPPGSDSGRGRQTVPVGQGTLWALVDTTSARHAIRLAAALLAGFLVAHGLELGNGYWVPMTSAVVVRGDFSGTLIRGVGRSVGTLLGAGLITLATTLTHPQAPILVVATALAALGTYALFRANYGLYSVFLTSTVVLLLALIGEPPVAPAEERVVATALGAALALVVFALWPTWTTDLLPRVLAAAVVAHRRYATHLLTQTTPRHRTINLVQLDALGRQARATRARLANLLSSLSERTTASTQGCITALFELAHAALALHAQLLATLATGGDPEASPVPAADPRVATANALAELDRAGCPPPPRSGNDR